MDKGGLTATQANLNPVAFFAGGLELLATDHPLQNLSRHGWSFADVGETGGHCHFPLGRMERGTPFPGHRLVDISGFPMGPLHPVPLPDGSGQGESVSFPRLLDDSGCQGGLGAKIGPGGCDGHLA